MVSKRKYSAMDQTKVTRDDRQQGRESTDDASGFSGQGGQRENDADSAEGTGYTGNSNTEKADSETP